MRLVAMLLVPAIFLGVLELSLRVIGYGHPTKFWVSSEVGGVEYLVPNTAFNYRFFPPALARAPLPMRMLKEKPAGTYRIFLFGESAAYGDPEPSYGMGRQLEVLLEQRYPGTDFEVICTAMTAINSHAILPIARECAELDGDLWVVYMGNNEMVGAFGAGTVFSAKAPPLWAVRGILALKATRLGQLLGSLAGGMSGEGSAPEEWGGIDMFTENPLAYDDPQRLTAYRNFRGNLRDILRAASGAEVPVLLSTVASNLKDCAPFISLPVNGSDSAERLFQEGRRLLESGELEKARAALVRARDHDALAVRADTRINNIIREQAGMASGDNVVLVDAPGLLSAVTPDGIPGEEQFYEHVHLTIEGNYRMARLMADEVVGLLPDGITSSDTGAWVGLEEIERQLAITLWDQHRLWNNMLSRNSVPPFTGQSTHRENLAYLQAQAQAVIARIGKDTPQADRQLYEDALARNPEDTTMRALYGQYLEAMGSRDEAIAQMRRNCELLPDLEWPHFYLAELLIRAGKTEEAAEALKRALGIRGDFWQARRKLEALGVNRPD
jgi:tetratricopeptide (TPR) repeat protein